MAVNLWLARSLARSNILSPHLVFCRHWQNRKWLEQSLHHSSFRNLGLFTDHCFYKEIHYGVPTTNQTQMSRLHRNRSLTSKCFAKSWANQTNSKQVCAMPQKLQQSRRVEAVFTTGGCPLESVLNHTVNSEDHCLCDSLTNSSTFANKEFATYWMKPKTWKEKKSDMAQLV